MTTTFNPIDAAHHNRFPSSIEQIMASIITNSWVHFNGVDPKNIEKCLTTAMCDLLGTIDIMVDVEYNFTVIDGGFDVAFRYISIGCLSTNQLSRFAATVLSYDDITLNQVTF